MKRREFLRLNINLALLSLCGGVGAGEIAIPWSGNDKKTLADVLYQLFPHPRLNKDVYKQVTEQISHKIAQSNELASMMKNAMDGLTGNSREKWSMLPPRDKTELLEEIQHTPFFQFVLNETLSGVYRHPDTWKLLGFEGSSLEFGGYINRGFNDIDWLPE